MSDVTLSKAVRTNLLSLQNTATLMEKTQQRLATGNKVNSALDNPSNFFTASALNSRAADMSNLLDSMASGIKVLEAANNGITALTKNLESMQSTLRQARQDKSFQTQSFEVNDNSIIKFDGGRFDMSSTIKLSDAVAKAGERAKVTTVGNGEYLGPTSSNTSIQGAGARAIISGLGGFSAGSEMTVAGVKITFDDGVLPEDIVRTIQTTLDADSTTEGKYHVMLGAGTDNANKLIIETIDPTQAAATVEFGQRTVQAVKGSVSFKFTDLESQVQVGNQTIATGSNFDDFVDALREKGVEGEYEVSTDDDGTITLTSTQYGVAAPTLTGVLEGTPAQAASTTFQVDFTEPGSFTVAGRTVNMRGTYSTARYDINLALTETSTLTVAGESVTIAGTGTAAERAASVQAQIEQIFEDGDLEYDVAVSEQGALLLTSRNIDGSTPPVVASGTETQTAIQVGAPNTNNGSAPAPSISSYQVALDGDDPVAVKFGDLDIVIPASTGSAADDALALEAILTQALGDTPAFTVEVLPSGLVTFTSTANTGVIPPSITGGDDIAAGTVTNLATEMGRPAARGQHTQTITLGGTAPTTITVNNRQIIVPPEGADADANEAILEQLTIDINAALATTGATAEIDEDGVVTITMAEDGPAIVPVITTGATIPGRAVASSGSVPADGSTPAYQVFTLDADPFGISTINVEGTEIYVPVFTSPDDVTDFEDRISALINSDPSTPEYTVDFDYSARTITINATDPLEVDIPSITSGTNQTGNAVGAVDNEVEGSDGERSTAEFDIDLTEEGPTSIVVGGNTVVIPGSTGNAENDALAAQNAIQAAVGDTFTVQVQEDGTVTIEAVSVGAVALPDIEDGEAIAAQESVVEVSSFTGGTGTSTISTYQLTLGAEGPANITVMGENFEFELSGVNADDMPALEDALEDFLDTRGINFSVSVSNLGLITLTSNVPGSFNPPSVTNGSNSVVSQEINPADAEISPGNLTANETSESVQLKISSALSAAGITGFSVEVDNDGLVAITANAPGAADAIQVTGALAADVNMEPGRAVSEGAQITTHVVGASVEHHDAAADTFFVSYDNKQAEIRVAGIKIGATAIDKVGWQSDTVASINAQLQSKGVLGVEAKFDNDGKLQIVAKTEETQTLTISGGDTTQLFGNNYVSIGSAKETGLNATKTTDKFVEYINKQFDGKVRASNDNGKLRIENLSTKALDLMVDTNANGVDTPLRVEGNAVRANLSKEFNELRDQLDKLADDSSFNGINLLRGDRLKITFNESGSSAIDIQSKDKTGAARGLNAATLDIISLDAQDLDTDDKIDAFLSKLSSALSDLRSQASTFGSNLSSVQNRQDFTKSMITTLQSGAANLTLADMNEEAANLLALQTRQSLSTSALSMASQGDQNILQLLR